MDDDIVEVEGPDGQIYEFPAGTTQEQAVAFFRRQSAQPLSTGERAVKGLADPIEGGAQLLEKMTPKGLRENINAANNWLAQYGVTEPVGPGGVGADVARREREYADRLAVTPGFEDGGVDWARLAGNVVNPVNIPFGMVGAARGVIPTMSSMAAAGAGAMLAPSQHGPGDEGRYWREKAGAAATGAGTAGLFRALGTAVSPAASRDPNVQLLRREGVSPTIGQMAQGHASAAEQRLSSTPVLGAAITSGRNRAIDEFNRAVGNRALRSIGMEVPRDLAPGHEMVSFVDDALGAAYERVLPNIRGQLDAPFQNNIATVRQMAQSMPDSQRNQLNRIIRDQIQRRFTNQGLASGETIKEIESELGRLARGYMRDPNYDNRRMGTAIRELQANLRDMIVRQNPDYADELQNINRGWAELVRLETAAGKAGTRAGVFSPAQYLSAVRQADPTLRRRGFSRGEALGQDIGRAAQQVLGTTVPDSGTVGRAALGLGVLGGSYAVHPGILLAEIGSTLPYFGPVQRGLARALADRPDWAPGAAGALRRAAAPAGASVGRGADIERIR